MPIIGGGKDGSGAAATKAAGPNPSGAQPAWARTTIDALAAARRSYTPEKAMQVVAVMDHLPAVQKAIAEFYTDLGRKSVDMVELPHGTAEFFAQLGGQQQRQHGALVTAMASAKKSVQDRVARILAQRQKDAAWDVSKHRGGW